MTIGAAIKQLRTRKHMNQLQLITKAKINQGFLSQIEKGQREPSLTVIKRIAGALDVPVQVLLLLGCETERSRRYEKQLRRIALLVNKIITEIGH